MRPLRFFLRRAFSTSAKSPAAAAAPVPVLIVGAGPVGLTLSILLSQYGVPSVVVEKRGRLSEHPQAHLLNNRTMEIFRKMEGLTVEIEAKQPPVEQWRRFVYCSTLSGPVFGTVDHLRAEDFESRHSPVSVAHFSQHHLGPLLYERAQRLGQKVRHVAPVTLDHGPVLMGHECVSIASNSKSVNVRLSATQGPSRQVVDVACQYVVAADGANSPIREMIGVAMEGEAEIQKYISVHFFSKDLGQLLLGAPEPGMLYFVFNSKAIGVVVAHNLEAGEFVAQIPFYPPQQRLEDFTSEVCGDIILELAGTKYLTVDVKTVKQWVMHAQVADHFLDMHGRVFLAGDAAHRFPPAGGFGLNTGVQDAHNLAWKLAAVLKGHASETLLSTYEVERQPVARANTALSLANFNAAMAVPAALGLDPSAARIVYGAINSRVGMLLPKKLQSAVLEGLFAAGRAQVSPVFLSGMNPIASARVSAMQRLLKEGHSLQLQFPAEDLGFRYGEGALLPEVDRPSSERTVSAPVGRRQEYTPSTQPGARLPHYPITIRHHSAPASSLKSSFSTLDLISERELCPVLIVGCNKSGCGWVEAALTALKSSAIRVKIVIMCPQGQEGNVPESVQKWASASDCEVVHAEVDQGWWDLCGVPDVGAILVRPDEHVAWRSRSAPDISSVEQLREVFGKVFPVPVSFTQRNASKIGGRRGQTRSIAQEEENWRRWMYKYNPEAWRERSLGRQYKSLEELGDVGLLEEFYRRGFAEEHKQLEQSFYDCDVVTLARRLLGKFMYNRESIILRITETEAYQEGESMFKAIFGRESCTSNVFDHGGTIFEHGQFNLFITAGKEGGGAVVLIKACSVVAGCGTIRCIRDAYGLPKPEELLNSAPKVGEALRGSCFPNELHSEEHGIILLDGATPEEILVGPRVWKWRADPQDLSKPWRFAIAGTPWISKPHDTLVPLA